MDLLKSGLSAVDPGRKVSESLSDDQISLDGGELVVIAIGKAATSMANGACDVLGDRVRSGIILTKDGHAAGSPPGFAIYEAAHPVPDQRGLAATRAILDIVDRLDRSDRVLVLISGGGSALFELPRSPLTLADMQTTTSLLLRAGAPIQDLNAVRSELSEVKGGGLRRRIGSARCLTLILSDVLGNDPRVIASGPTVMRTPDPSNAFLLLDRYSLTAKVPPAVLTALTGVETGEVRSIINVDRDIFRIVADNDVFIDSIAAEARRRGLRSRIVWRKQEGEARDMASKFVEALDSIGDDIDIVIGGGETTVVVNGDGTGGRNTEFALAAGLGLLDGSGSETWMVASIASDGQDGTVAAAGAMTDAEGVRRAEDEGLDPRGALAANDSGGYFERTGELVRTGPTGTNVNDVYIGIRLG